MNIHPFRAVYPNLDYITSPDAFFGSVKEEYPKQKKNGFFTRTAQESIYVCQIKTPKRTYTGLIACTDIKDYIKGRIKKHENTLSAKEQQQMNLIISRSALVKPILLTHAPIDKLNKIITNVTKSNKAFYTVTFEESAQTHTFWEICEGQTIEKVQKIFKKDVPITYIADGHHRSSTTALMYNRMSGKSITSNYDQMLCAFFPSSELDVHDYNRVVEGLNDMTGTSFMARIAQLFDIEILEKARKPKVKYEIIMYIEKEWFALKWKQKVLDTYKKEAVVLDATLLNDKVLGDIIGIEDVRTDLRVKYVEGPKGLDDIRIKTNRDPNRVGFVLYPVKLEDLMQIADANKVMPPKSTWFEPRMKNGLIVQEL